MAPRVQPRHTVQARPGPFLPSDVLHPPAVFPALFVQLLPFHSSAPVTPTAIHRGGVGQLTSIAVSSCRRAATDTRQCGCVLRRCRRRCGCRTFSAKERADHDQEGNSEECAACYAPGLHRCGRSRTRWTAAGRSSLRPAPRGLQCRAEQLDVQRGGAEHLEPHVGRPLEEGTQVVAVGLELRPE